MIFTESISKSSRNAYSYIIGNTLHISLRSFSCFLIDIVHVTILFPSLPCHSFAARHTNGSPGYHPYRRFSGTRCLTTLLPAMPGFELAFQKGLARESWSLYGVGAIVVIARTCAASMSFNCGPN